VPRPGALRQTTTVRPLEGQAALVTGGGGGIGSAGAAALARDGAAVVLMGRTEATLLAAADRIRAEVDGADVHHVVGDALDAAALDDALTTAGGRAERLAAVVSVVGGGTIAPLLAFDAAAFSRELERNVVSAFLAVRHGAATMAPTGGGSIVCISSVAARIPYPNMTPYGAAKAAVDLLVRGAALELAPLGVRVNAIRAGLIRSDATRDHLRDNASVIEALPDRRPLGRAGEPVDVAAAVRLLAGPEGSWITGQSFAVDGGKELVDAPPYLGAVARRRLGDVVGDAAEAGQITG
jgi:NAD(P)-dependent dehydrogenase (short-subunit alcohol dehydrogenase family)